MNDSHLRTYGVATALAALREKLTWILITGVALGAVGLVYALSTASVYKAEAFIYPRVPGFAEGAFPSRVFVDTTADQLTAYTDLADLDQVARETSQALDGTVDPVSVDDNVTVTSTGTGLISIEAEAEAPEAAAKLANTYAQVVVDGRREASVRVIDRVEQTLRANLAEVPKGSVQARNLQDRLDELSVYRDFQTGEAEQAQRATEPPSPETRSIVSSAVGGAIAGMLIAIASVLIADRVRPSIRDRRTAEEALGAPVMTTIADGGDDKAIEALRAKVLNSPGQGSARTVVLLPLRGEPANDVARRLAAAVALSGHRAISIDADLGSTGVGAGPGLAEILEGKAESSSVIASREGGADSITPGDAARGKEDTAALLQRPAMNNLLKDLGKVYRLVVIAAPSPIVSADAVSLISHAPDILAIVALGARERDCRALTDEVRSVGGVVRGVVLIER